MYVYVFIDYFDQLFLRERLIDVFLGSGDPARDGEERHQAAT